MPSKNVLARVDAALFRQEIRPALYGKIGVLEPEIAAACAEATAIWLQDVITATIRDTRIHDSKGAIEAELRENARVFGAYSLNELRGEFYGYPWLFAHEFGAEIHPLTGQFLAIPIYNALRADGSPIFRDPKSWQRFGSFVYTQRSTGRKFLAYRPKGGDGKLKILYILVEKVTIPARLGLTTHVDDMYPILWAMWFEIFAEIGINSGILEFWDA